MVALVPTGSGAKPVAALAVIPPGGSGRLRRSRLDRAIRPGRGATRLRVAGPSRTRGARRRLHQQVPLLEVRTRPAPRRLRDPRSARHPRVRGRRHDDPRARHRSPRLATAQPARPGEACGHGRPVVRGPAPARGRPGMVTRGARGRWRRLRRPGCARGRGDRRDPRDCGAPTHTGAREFDGRHFSFSGVQSFPRPARAGGVPIEVGGTTPAAIRRAARRGDGWLSLGLRGDRLAAALRLLADEATAAGRDPAAIDVTLSGVTTSATVDRSTLEQAAALGARRVVLNLGSASLEEARDELRQIARRTGVTPPP